MSAARLGVMQALGLAVLRKVERLAALHDLVQELERQELFCPYTPNELLLLEQNGLHFDATTGLFRIAEDAPPAGVRP